MKDDTISRQAAINALEREKTYCTAYKDGYAQTDYFKQYNMGLTDGIKALNKLPSAERHGKWEIADDMPRLDNTFSIRCSLCGQLMLAHPNDENPNFCCNCGAKMVEVEE